MVQIEEDVTIANNLSLEEIVGIDDIEIYNRCFVYGTHQGEEFKESIEHGDVFYLSQIFNDELDFGGLSQLPEETDRNYYERILRLSRQGLITTQGREFLASEKAVEARYSVGVASDDYYKCVMANKVVLAAAGITAVGIGLAWLGQKSRIPYADIPGLLISSPGRVVMEGTGFGFATIWAYRKTKLHIEEHGKLDPRFAKTISGSYCARQGLKLAVKEAGLYQSPK